MFKEIPTDATNHIGGNDWLLAVEMLHVNRWFDFMPKHHQRSVVAAVHDGAESMLVDDLQRSRTKQPCLDIVMKWNVHKIINLTKVFLSMDPAGKMMFQTVFQLHVANFLKPRLSGPEQ